MRLSEEQYERTIQNGLAEIQAQRDHIAHLERLVRIMLDNDPYDDIADGVVVIDLWRQEARAALAKEKTDE